MIDTQYSIPSYFLRKLDSIPGWCSEHKANELYKLVIGQQSTITCELGTYGGRSLIAMALAHKDMNNGFALGFDAYNNKVCTEGTNSPLNNDYWEKQDLQKIYKDCIDAIKNLGVDDYASVVKLKSQTAGILFPNESIDIIHQDSNHNVETISAELETWTPKLKKGGLWIADDVQWIEAKDAYAKIPSYGFDLIADHYEWVVYRKL